MNTTLIQATPRFSTIVATPVRHCEICNGVANITVNQDHFCSDCMRTRRVRAYLLGKAAK